MGEHLAQRVSTDALGNGDRTTGLARYQYATPDAFLSTSTDLDGPGGVFDHAS
jgi:hypothetical protein